MALDRYDLIILQHLAKEGRMSWTKLADHLNLSVSSVQRRVQAMTSAGVIRHFAVVVNRHALGQEVRAFVHVRVNRSNTAATCAFRQMVLTCSEVEHCYKVAGNTDFMLTINARNLTSFAQFLENKILCLPGVVDATSSIILEALKEHGQPLVVR